MLIAELFSFSAFAVAPASRHCPSCGRLTDLHNRAPSRQRRHTLKGRSGGLGAELEAHACRSSSLISQLWPAAQRPPAGTPPSAAPLPSAQDWPCATARRGAIAALAASSVAEPRIAIRRARSASSLAGRLARRPQRRRRRLRRLRRRCAPSPALDPRARRRALDNANHTHDNPWDGATRHNATLRDFELAVSNVPDFGTSRPEDVLGRKRPASL